MLDFIGNKLPGHAPGDVVNSAYVFLYDSDHPEWLAPVAQSQTDSAGNYTLSVLANAASNNNASVTGGASNKASGEVSSVSGGEANIASGLGSSVSGGLGNDASGTHCVEGSDPTTDC